MQCFEIEKFNLLGIEEQKLEYNKLKEVLPESILESFFFKEYSFSNELNELDNVNLSSQSALKIHLSPKIKQYDVDQILKNFSSHTQLTEEKKKILRNILSTMSHIYRSLEPIFKIFDLKYDLALVGGSLRDFLLGKETEIKDMDVVFAIKDIIGFSHPELVEENARWMVKEYKLMREELADLTNDQILSIESTIPEAFSVNAIWYKLDKIIELLNVPEFVFDQAKKTPRIEQFFFHIIHHVLRQSVQVKEAYPPRALNDEELDHEEKNEIWKAGYHNSALRGVIKLESENFSYPVDILFTRKEVSNYISTFDFEICKTWLCYDETKTNILSQYLYDINEEQINKEYRNISCTWGFVRDYLRKELTFLLSRSSLSAIEFSLLNHYRRIKNKYPDYEFSLGEDITTKSIKEEIKEHITRCLRYEKLDTQLACNDSVHLDNIKRRKI